MLGKFKDEFEVRYKLDVWIDQRSSLVNIGFCFSLAGLRKMFLDMYEVRSLKCIHHKLSSI